MNRTGDAMHQRLFLAGCTDTWDICSNLHLGFQDVGEFRSARGIRRTHGDSLEEVYLDQMTLQDLAR